MKENLNILINKEPLLSKTKKKRKMEKDKFNHDRLHFYINKNNEMRVKTHLKKGQFKKFLKSLKVPYTTESNSSGDIVSVYTKDKRPIARYFKRDGLLISRDDRFVLKLFRMINKINPKMEEGGKLNPYAICTSSIGDKEGTNKRSEWDKNAKERYDNCLESVSKKEEGGELKSDFDKFKSLYREALKEYNQNKNKATRLKLSSAIHVFYRDFVTFNPEYLSVFIEWNNKLPKTERFFTYYSDSFENFKENPYSLISDDLKSSKSVSKVKYELNPKNKGLVSLMKDFVSNDELRINLMPIHFDDKGVVGTDAHKLLFIKGNSDFKGNYCITKDCFNVVGGEKAVKDSKYPNYQAIIPSDVAETTKFKTQDLYNFVSTIVNNSLCDGNHGISIRTEEGVMDFNGRLLKESLSSMMKLGYKELSCNRSSIHTDSKPITLTPVGNEYQTSDFETDFVLLMPVMFNDKPVFGYDLHENCVFANTYKGDDECVNPYLESKNIVKVEDVEKKSKEIRKSIEVLASYVFSGVKTRDVVIDKYFTPNFEGNYYEVSSPLETVYFNDYVFHIVKSKDFAEYIMIEDYTGASVGRGASLSEVKEKGLENLNRQSESLKEAIDGFIESGRISPRYSDKSKTIKDAQKIKIKELLNTRDYGSLYEIIMTASNKDSRRAYSDLSGTNIVNMNQSQIKDYLKTAYGYDVDYEVKKEQDKKKLEKERQEKEYWDGIKSKYPLIDFSNTPNKTVKRIDDYLNKRVRGANGVVDNYKYLEDWNGTYKRVYIDEWTKSGDKRAKPIVEYYIGNDKGAMTQVPKMIYDRINLPEKQN